MFARSLAGLPLVTIALVAGAAHAQVTPVTPYYALISGDSATLRSAPTSNAYSVASIPQNAIVIVDGEASGWNRVLYPAGLHAFVPATAATVSGENPTATEALQSRVVGEVVREAMRGVVDSAEFRNIWEATTSGGHRLLVAELGEDWGEPVILDFTPLNDNIQAEIAALDLELPPDFSFDPENLRIQVFDAPTAAGLAAEVETLILARLDTLTEEEIAQLLG